MAIQIDKRFVVDAPAERVWAYLTNPHRVAECLPGASITEQDGLTYRGTMKVKLGPVSSTYEGTVHFDRMDADAHTAALSAEGRDTRGKGAADMTMTSELAASEQGTEVHVVSSVNVTGVLAQLGRGMVEDVSEQLFEQFTRCMKATLEGEPRNPDPVQPPTPAASPKTATAAPAEPRAPSGSSSDRATPSAPPRQDALDLGTVGGQAAARAGARMLRRPLFWVVFGALAAAGWFFFR